MPNPLRSNRDMYPPIVSDTHIMGGNGIYERIFDRGYIHPTGDRIDILFSQNDGVKPFTKPKRKGKVNLTIY